LLNGSLNSVRAEMTRRRAHQPRCADRSAAAKGAGKLQNRHCACRSADVGDAENPIPGSVVPASWRGHSRYRPTPTATALPTTRPVATALRVPMLSLRAAASRWLSIAGASLRCARALFALSLGRCAVVVQRSRGQLDGAGRHRGGDARADRRPAQRPLEARALKLSVLLARRGLDLRALDVRTLHPLDDRLVVERDREQVVERVLGGAAAGGGGASARHTRQPQPPG